MTNAAKKIAVEGATLAVVDEGNGPPVLLVHGFPLSRRMWDAQVADLSRDFRVIAPDLRGFGESSVDGAVATMEQFAVDLNHLLDALQVHEPIALCGLSMGGYIAFQFLRKYSRRVAKLILCDTRAVADAPEAAKGRRELAARVLEEGVGPAAEALAPKLFCQSTIRQRPDIVEAGRRIMFNADPRGVAAALEGMAQRQDVRDLLPKIRIPTLVVVGKEDAISTPDEMRTIANDLPDSTLVVVEDAGHMAPMEQPRAVNEAIRRFLAR